MNETDALEILKDPDSTLSYDKALEIITALKQSIVEHDDALEERIIGAHSFYEGEYNGLRIAERILNKLFINNKE